MASLTTIGFDADDTLWQNEQFFRMTEARFAELLADFAEADHLTERLIEAEKRNLARYGFGIKGFTLSMIETAIEVTEGRVPARVIGEILEAGREMLVHPVETLPHVTETLERLAPDYRIVLITKGDLFDQERKLAQSGLGDFFDAVEIVIADGSLKFCLELVVGTASDDIDRAADRVTAVKRTLRTAKNLDTLDIEKTREIRRWARDIDAVDVNRRTRIRTAEDVIRSNAADIDLRERRILRDVQIGRHRHQVANILDARSINLLA